MDSTRDIHHDGTLDGNRRRLERLPISMPVTVYSFPETESSVGELLNISEEGMLVRAPQSRPQGDLIGVELPGSEEVGRITVVGDIRWASGDSFGIRICAATPAHRLRLERLLSALRQQVRA